MDINQKRNKEIHLVHEMIRLYCTKNHKQDLCADCDELYSYAKKRIENCPMMETKTFCSQCKIHCYKPDMRQKIRDVMRFSGPRMLFHHPLLTISHGIETMKGKLKK